MKAPDFIFMLTRDDRTVPDALGHVAEVLAAGVRHIGFKDIGLPISALRQVAQAIRDGGSAVYLEVVSLDARSERRSAEAAVELDVDVLMGGTRPDVVLPAIRGRGLRYFPFAGQVVGHPSRLRGSVASIVDSARALTAREGVDGLDLLAWRFDGEVEELIREVCACTTKPVVVAGSIDRPERISALVRAGAAGFTVGTAAFDRVFTGSTSLTSEVGGIRAALDTAIKALVGPQKVTLADGFARIDSFWSPRIAGDINGMQIKLAKFRGAFHWHLHEQEDELFLVHRGTLLMRFRDGDVRLQPGEFMIVPHGVEHLPVAETEDCEVVLLEPATTLNTGNVVNERTVIMPERL